jgi:peptide/nickel transport system permease protein
MTSRRTVVALIVLALVHLAALAAPFLSPYPPTRQDRTMPYAPPTPLRFVDDAGALHLRPFVYAAADEYGSGRYVEDRSARHPVRFLVRDPQYGTLHLFGVDEDARLFLLGTDGSGRDQLSRLLHGARISLFAGLAATAVTLALGWLFGLASGYAGGLVDAVIMRAADVFLALPWLYLLFAVRAVLPLHLSAAHTFLLLVVVIGIVDWARPARLVRGVALSARERGYVLAARGFGASSFYILRRHVAPQTFGLLLTQAALLVPQYVLAEVTLSFLGVGVGEPTPSWGNMLASLQRYHVLASYWWMWAPGVVLTVVFLAYFALAEALRDALGPASP